MISRLVLLLAISVMLAAPAAAQSTTNFAPNATPAPGPVDPAVEMLRQAYAMLNQNNLDGALAKINASIKLNPKILSAYIMRGGVYFAKKDWKDSEADFNTAEQLDPANIVVKFQIAEISFQQKLYDQARPKFAALQGDPNMGDFAAYNVFLCDLMGGKTDAATKELAAFNDAGTHPSYYFSNAAWALVHHNTEEARSWLTSAANIYIPGKSKFYAQPLFDLGFLPLPAPPAK